MKLSIIVPIYNVEQYLRKCVDSLLMQDLSLQEYEIILVDDGSTDGSGAIVDEYGANCSNIKVIHQENAGLSEARNNGVDNAQGKYVMFVDSDDYLEPNVIKGLVDKMEADNLDVLRFNYRNVNEQYHVFEPNKYSKLFVDYRDEVCDGKTFLSERLGGGCYACQFALKRELTRIRFTRGRYFEDTDWTPRMLMQAQRVTSVDTMVYNYLVRSGSITQSVSQGKKLKVINDKIWLIGQLQHYSEPLEDKCWFDGMITNTVISILTSVSLEHYTDKKHYLSQLRDMGVFPLRKHHITPAANRKRLLINLSPELFCLLMHLSHNK